MKYLYLFLGSLFLVIGIIGIFLPLLPTTPFLLLTAICFERGSDKFHTWLLSHKIFGPPILDWQNKKVIRPQFKILACSMMIITAFFLLQKDSVPLIGKVSYSIFMLLMIAFIVSRKSY